MADIADMSDDRIEIDLAAARAKRHPSLPRLGMCHYCEEKVGPSELFCGRDCSQDWHDEQAAMKRNGR